MIQNLLAKMHSNNIHTTKSFNTGHSSLLKSVTCDSISFKSITLEKDALPQKAIQCLFNEIKAQKGKLEIEIGDGDKITFTIKNCTGNSSLESSTITFLIKDLIKTTTGRGTLEKLADSTESSPVYKIVPLPTDYQEGMIERILNAFEETTGIKKEEISNSASPVEYMKTELTKLTNLGDQKHKKAQKLITTYVNQSNKFKNEQNDSKRIAHDILSRYNKIAEDKEDLKTRLLDWFNTAPLFELKNLKKFLGDHSDENCS